MPEGSEPRQAGEHRLGGLVVGVELERAIPQVTQKMLAQQLRTLEADGLIRRSVRQVTPPHVE